MLRPDDDIIGSTITKPELKVPAWFGPALAVAQHQDKKRSWPWYGKFLHWLLRSWWCPCCRLERGRDA